MPLRAQEKSPWYLHKHVDQNCVFYILNLTDSYTVADNWSHCNKDKLYGLSNMA